MLGATMQSSVATASWHPLFVGVYPELHGPGSVVGIATGYGLDGPGIESRWGRGVSRFSAPFQPGPGAHPVSRTMGTGSFSGVKSVRVVTLTPHPLLVPWFMGRTDCTEPQCLYKGDLYLFIFTLNCVSLYILLTCWCKMFIMGCRELAEVLGAVLRIISEDCIQVTFGKGTWHKVVPGAGPYKTPANS